MRSNHGGRRGGTHPSSPVAYALGNPKTVYFAAASLTIALWALVFAYSPEFDDKFEVPGSESAEFARLLHAEFPDAGTTSATLVLTAEKGTPAKLLTSYARQLRRDITDQPKVVNVTRPAHGLSPDRSTLILTVSYTDKGGTPGRAEVKRLDDAVADNAAPPGITTDTGGPLVDNSAKRGSIVPEVAGGLIAAVVLFIALGRRGRSIAIAAIVAGWMLLTTLGAVNALALILPIPSVAVAVSVMIGLGVTVDYLLFILKEVVDYLENGATNEDAAAAAFASAGRAVFTAACTVIVALVGLLALDVPAVTGIGASVAAAVAVALLAALILLPGVLSQVGVTRRGAPADVEPVSPTSWVVRWTRAVVARPVTSLFAGIAALAILAIPAFSLQLGQLDAGLDPEDTTQRQAYDQVERAFGPGANGPLQVLLEAPEIARYRITARTINVIAQIEGVSAVETVRSSEDFTLLTITLDARPREERTNETIERIRSADLPADVIIGGKSATFHDISDVVKNRAPWLLAIVAGLSVMALTVAFNAPVVAVKAALLNVLAFVASLGMVVAVFQWGWGGALIGAPGDWAIVAFIPVLAFALILGLSMDYEIFIVCRIRRAFARHRDNAESIREGLADSAGVVTAAALIMASVFAGFVFDADPNIKMMGFALAAAVVLDATIVRLVLVPASMTLLGSANWWTPFTPLDDSANEGPHFSGTPSLVLSKQEGSQQ